MAIEVSLGPYFTLQICFPFEAFAGYLNNPSWKFMFIIHNFIFAQGTLLGFSDVFIIYA